MSYLIGLYIYYHGNNPEAFGITKGARDEDLNNGGIYIPIDVKKDLLPTEVVQEIQEREKKEEFTRQQTNWDAMMAEAIKKSQQESYALYQKKLIGNTLYENTPDIIMDEDEGFIDLDFFDELNGVRR